MSSIELRAPVIAVANESGGVGKTTTAANVAAALALAGLRVVAIDGDNQGDLTYAVGADLGGADLDALPGFADAIEAASGGEDPDTAWLRSTAVTGLRVVVGNEGLLEIKDALSDARAEGEAWVAAAVGAFARLDDVDVVVVDCPPAASSVTIGTLLVADLTLVVVAAWKYTSLVASRKLLHRVAAMVGRGGSGQARVVLQGHKPRRRLHREMLEAMELEAAGVFATIPYNKSAEEAPVNDIPLVVSDGDSTTGYALADLASAALGEVQTIRGEA